MKELQNNDNYKEQLLAYLDALGMLEEDQQKNNNLCSFINSIIYPCLANWMVAIHKSGIDLEVILQKTGNFGIRLFDKFNGDLSPILKIGFETLEGLYFNKLIQMGIAMVKLVNFHAEEEGKVIDSQLIDNCIMGLIQAKLERTESDTWLKSVEENLSEETFIDELLIEIKIQAEAKGIPIFK